MLLARSNILDMRNTPADAMGIATPEERVLIALVRAATHASARSDAVVRAAGLSPSQYNVLRILRHAGEAGLSRVGIAERMVAREPDLTRILSGLSRLKAVQTRQSQVDRRSRVSVITERGRAILDELDAAVREAAIASLGGLGKSQLKELENLLAGIGDDIAE
jgi:DNA-binding MarR family transcriptional regulator